MTITLTEAKTQTNQLHAVLKTVQKYVEELAINEEQIQIFDDAVVSIIATADADINTGLRYIQLKKTKKFQDHLISSRN